MKLQEYLTQHNSTLSDLILDKYTESLETELNNLEVKIINEQIVFDTRDRIKLHREHGYYLPESTVLDASAVNLFSDAVSTLQDW